MPMIPVKEAPRGVRISEPTYKEHETDLLIVGGGMGATGAAVEAVRWAKPLGIKVFLCDKAALERSGAVARALPPSTPSLKTTLLTTTCAWSATTLCTSSAMTSSST